MRADMVLQAFAAALCSRRRTKGTIFHSDRGSQFASATFRSALRAAGFVQSMSARSNPYDNAWTESLLGTLKREMLQDGSFQNFQDANTEIFEYIEGYYNTHRKHSALGYRSPDKFERESSTSAKQQMVQKTVASQECGFPPRAQPHDRQNWRAHLLS